MKHPSIEDLALYAGGELGWWARIPVRRHVNGCMQCQKEIVLFGEAAKAARAEAEAMPAGVQWERLAEEMRANVRLGLAASEAISAYQPVKETEAAPAMSWRMVAMASGFLALLSVGYWLSAARKSEQLAALRSPAPVVLEASEGSVGISDGTKRMELRGPQTNRSAAMVTVSTEGAAGAQYVDDETGQITVNHVYVE